MINCIVLYVIHNETLLQKVIKGDRKLASKHFWQLREPMYNPLYVSRVCETIYHHWLLYAQEKCLHSALC